MAFINTRFPLAISNGSRGGPRWATSVTITDGGYEYRNNPWQYPLHDYNAAYGVKKAADLEQLVAIFHAARGMLNGFRFRDPLDWKSCARDATPAYTDQTLISAAAGGETTTQLVKAYTFGATSLTRKITRPVAGTVLVGKNGLQLTETTDYTIDNDTGIITLVVALTAGDTVTAGFQFDVPVRFNTNELSVQLQEYDHGSASCPLVELRE